MSPPPEPNSANIAASAAKKSSRACTECHNAKGKCVFTDESRAKCDRCFRLNRECVPHLSRQGQRKKKNDTACAESVTAVASPETAVSCPVASSGSGMANRAPEAEAGEARSRQGLLVDMLQRSQPGSSHLFGPGSSLLAHLQNVANAKAATAQQQSSNQPAGPPSSGAARFPEGAFHRSMLAANEHVLPSNAAANQQQDPHLAHLLRQAALANLNETGPPSATASNALTSLMSLIQNNSIAVSSLGASSTAPANLFGSNNPAPNSANRTATSFLDTLLHNARQQQVQRGLQENRPQEWQKQQQQQQQTQQQTRIRNLIDQWLAHQARVGQVPQAPETRPGELLQNLGIGDQGTGTGILLSLGRGSNAREQQENQYEEQESGRPSECGIASEVNALSQEKSRLKKTKKAHLLPGTDVVDIAETSSATGDDDSSEGFSSEIDTNYGCHAHKRSASNGESSFHQVRAKRAKANDDFSASLISSHKPRKDHVQPSASPSPAQQTYPYPQEGQHPHEEKYISIIDSAENFCDHLLRITSKRNMDFSALKNHFGVQCMIREWIALAFSRRSFGYLAKASQMAVKFGISMNRILSGIDEDGLEELGAASLSAKKKEKSMSGSKKNAGDSKVCIGGRMNYLLGMLLEPRSVQAHPISERRMLTPHLDPSFLSHIAPVSCSSFEDMDVRGRWIIIQETYRGDTKFYCSPMVERNVMCWTHMSQIYEDNLADVFSLIFTKDQFDRFQSYLAREVSLRYDEGARTRPVHAPMMKIRLFSKNWGETDYDDEHVVVTKEMVDEAVTSDFPTRHVDVMLVSVQTMDKHLCYLEFFDPQDAVGHHSNPRRIVTPDPSVPPTYAGTFPHHIF